ncbi:MAG: PEP-CTERM sorting domain-containing protein [Myxococcota bacterium]
MIDMSADGSVATGRGESSTGFEAFVWDAVNGLRGLGDLPGGQTLSEPYAISTDGSTVVGYGYSDLGPEAFVWNEAGGLLGLGDLEGGEFASIATAVSADGSIVVGFSATGFGSEPFIWDPVRGMQRLGERPGRLTSRRPTAISDDGSIVVGVDYTARTGDQAVIWDATGQMQSLDILLRSLGVDMTGWKLSQAVDVSADGRTIVGYGINPSGAQEAWIAIIPEPATSSLLGIGLTLLGARRVSIRPNRAPRT